MEIAELIKRCIRILHISRKPTNDEYSKTAKITALGMVVLGVIGLIVWFIFNLLQ